MKYYLAPMEGITGHVYRNTYDKFFNNIDKYSDEQICILCTGSQGEENSALARMANGEFNRIEIGGEFGNTIEEVITKENQFAYWRKDITESTILAVEYAFQIEDTTGGCIAFRSDEKPDEWYGWEYAFIDDAGHHFYREKEEY